MVPEEFINFIRKIKLSTYIGLEDFADKLSFLYSVVLLIIFLTVVTIKSYFFQPISCYISTEPAGLNFKNYLESYCWLHGLIGILNGERFPASSDEWATVDDRRITFYQWVPLILGSQCIMFYTPRIIWQLICNNPVKTDLEVLINDASKASNGLSEERYKAVEILAKMIEDILFQQKGKMSKFCRKFFNSCNFCAFLNHFGIWKVFLYMMIKCLYFINIIAQLIIMKTFIGLDVSLTSFGSTFLKNIIQAPEYHESGIFPKDTYCYLGNIRTLGTTNIYIVQCTLPINLLIENIYVFLWFWMFIVGFFSVISLPIWFLRIAFLKNRKYFIKRFLLITNNYKTSDELLLNQFIREFLQRDGVFLIHMIFINNGTLITSDIVQRLWMTYKDKYKNMELQNLSQGDTNLYELVENE